MKISFIESSTSDAINSLLKSKKILRSGSKFSSVSAVAAVVLSFIAVEPARALPFLQNATAQGGLDVIIQSRGPLGGPPFSISASATNDLSTIAGFESSTPTTQTAVNVFQAGGGITGVIPAAEFHDSRAVGDSLVGSVVIPFWPRSIRGGLAWGRRLSSRGKT